MTALNKAKRSVDLGMTATLLLLMGYALVGELAHEVLGCTMFALMIAHMALNHAWYRGLGKGRYTAFRAVQTAMDFLILGSMLVSLASGIRLSKHVFEPLGLSYSLQASRIAHLLASHWGFCLMSIHLGMHWPVIAASFRKGSGAVPEPRSLRLRLIPRGIVSAVAAYGLWAFIARDFWRYMVLMTRFAFFDYEEPLALFLADHIAIMVFFIAVGLLLAEKTKLAGLPNRKNTSAAAQSE